MPSKRRKSSSAHSSGSPKRRQTRSSTKATSIHGTPVKGKEMSGKPPNSEISRSPKTTPSKGAHDLSESENSKSSMKVHSRNDSGTVPDNASTSKEIAVDGTSKVLSITHSSIKSPIHCELYHTLSSSAEKRQTTTLIFTHGAGGTLSAPAVVHFREGYVSKLPIFLFQGCMNLGARVKAFHACVGHSRSQNAQVYDAKQSPLLLGGRSMGSRAAVLTALDIVSAHPTVPVSLVLCSYPLVAPKGDIDTRSAPLLSLPPHSNVLFIVGSKDAMCPLEELDEVRNEMQARSWLVVVEGLDHGMRGKEDQELGKKAGEVAAMWVSGERWEGEKRLRVGNDEWEE